MTLGEIGALPVPQLAERDAHLYLWTTQRFLHDAMHLVTGWGFKQASTLVWCKARHGTIFGPTFQPTVEFVLFAKRGHLKAQSKIDSQWFQWPKGRHSQKPEAFLDIVEQVSPGPRVELFARRNRLGWDTWGNESLNHVELQKEGAK
jgi:N6-adenosine-specific RNA methylase IME4